MLAISVHNSPLVLGQANVLNIKKIRFMQNVSMQCKNVVSPSCFLFYFILGCATIKFENLAHFVFKSYTKLHS